MDWYDFLRDFQSAIVGAVGFLGVIITLIANAWIARNHAARELSEQRRIVETAQIATFKVLESSFRGNADHPAPERDAVWLFPKLQYNLYENFRGDLGRLKPRTAEKVLWTGLLVDQLNRRLAQLAVSATDEYLTIPAKHIPHVRVILGNMADEMRTVVGMLEETDN